jgi:hypothetical protein
MAARFDEVPIEIDGRRYRYYLGTYGLRALERSVGKPWPRVIAEAMETGWGYDIALTLFHSGLIFHHEDITERQASLLLDKMSVERFAEIFAEAMKGLQAPDDGGEPRNPPTPAAPTNGIGINPLANG